jgi:hypothetical protein
MTLDRYLWDNIEEQWYHNDKFSYHYSELEIPLDNRDFHHGLTDFTLYPNPVKEQFLVRANNYEGTYNYSLWDIKGNCLLNKFNLPAQQTETIKMNAFAKGIYFLKIQYQDEVMVKKVIKN